MPAALAYCCADAQGKGDAMADALIATPAAELTAEGCEKLAAALGVDLERYRRDAADPRTRARIDADVTAAKAAGVKRLPTIYVGAQLFSGAGATVDDLAAALTRA